MFVLPMVVAVNVRVKIRLKVKRTDRVVNTINTTLDCAPKRLDRVDVGNATNILLGGVLDNLMGISKLFNLIVAGKFIGKDDCLILFSNLRSIIGSKVLALTSGTTLVIAFPCVQPYP